MAEGTGSSPVQCEFESRGQDQIQGENMSIERAVVIGILVVIFLIVLKAANLV